MGSNALSPSSLPILPSISVLPANSLVLVTGVNSLIASHAADQLLAAGYRVLGTVRSLSKTSYLLPLFSRFSLHQIPDVATPGAWDSLFSSNPDIATIAHVVSRVDQQISDADAAAAEESFLFTSFAWAAWTPDPKKVTLPQESWNNEAVNLARDKKMGNKEKGMAGFMALKILVEKGVRDWVKKENSPFAFNTLLLDTVIGECLAPQEQGIPSTAGMVQFVWENTHVEVLDMMQPQWYVDCRDAGRMYVALLATKPIVDRERVFAFAKRYSWFQVAQILERLYPERADKLARPKDYGKDQTTVPNKRCEELLARLGQDGWRSLKESIRENAKSWLKLEKAEVTDHMFSRIAS
ncbi:hypothetical protein QBC38DRAFT_460134 [Podospora fimiseda]|uniref:NAD-dependent epimerase/dehydratase domain-containing protein n=1 Tax=Podospora fimiseda TaxID=252190 RepID=A0AAN6YP26_9PEZI|nr:hypothetical protein QBC38DRAFT_460134 [Podospora fimiseda]